MTTPSNIYHDPFTGETYTHCRECERERWCEQGKCEECREKEVGIWEGDEEEEA